jgi:hypothetical protein
MPSSILLDILNRFTSSSICKVCLASPILPIEVGNRPELLALIRVRDDDGIYVDDSTICRWYLE